MDVQKEIIDLSCRSSIEEFFRRCKDFRCKAAGVSIGSGRPEHARIVIHDRHDLSSLQHDISVSIDQNQSSGLRKFQPSLAAEDDANLRLKPLNIQRCLDSFPPREADGEAVYSDRSNACIADGQGRVLYRA